jgi:hypothetical protein
MRLAPILHKTNKLCTVSFRHNGHFISLKRQRFQTRQAALSHVKAYYRGASQISVVFFVPYIDGVV